MPPEPAVTSAGSAESDGAGSVRDEPDAGAGLEAGLKAGLDDGNRFARGAGVPGPAGEALAALRARARGATSSTSGRRRGRPASRRRPGQSPATGPVGASAPPSDGGRTRRRRPRHRVVALGSALAVAVLAASGVAWASRPEAGPEPALGLAPAAVAAATPSSASSSPPAQRTRSTAASPTSAPSVAGARWEAVLASVDAARGEAFAALDREGLAAAVVPGSTAWRADLAQLEALAGAGVRPVGQRWEVLEVTEVAASAQHAVLAVVDRRTAYDLVDDAGSVIAHRPARERARWRVELVGGPEDWRVSSVVARA